MNVVVVGQKGSAFSVPCVPPIVQTRQNRAPLRAMALHCNTVRLDPLHSLARFNQGLRPERVAFQHKYPPCETLSTPPGERMQQPCYCIAQALEGSFSPIVIPLPIAG